MLNYTIRFKRKNMLRFKDVLIILLCLSTSCIYSQKQLSNDEKHAVIEKIKVLIDSNYVFIDKVEFINKSLDSLKLTDTYIDAKEHKSLAQVLTKGLIDITKDLHFAVQYNPEFIKGNRERNSREAKPKNQEEPKKEKKNWDLWYAQKENFGFEKVEILGGNIGYIKFNFWHHLDWAKPTIDASMKFVSNTDALIIDLTENGGGYSPTDSYLASYFFDSKPKLWMSSYERRTNETLSVYTFQDIGGERYLNKPVYILVSENSFSLAEQFAYAMKHFKKATIVGQTSSGAAHAIDYIEVNDNFMIQLPISRSIHPVTKTDWEGTGVIPNKVSSNNEALKTAHLEGLNLIIEHLKKQTIVGPILKRYHKIKLALKNR